MTTLSRPSPFSTERCTVVSTHAHVREGGVAAGRRDAVCTLAVVHSGVGGEAVRGGGEEGPPQRGVPLPPLHGLRPSGGVQEDAAGETVTTNGQIAQTPIQRHHQTKEDLPFQAGMALYKIVPKNPYYFWSVMSLVMQVRSHTCAWLRAVHYPVNKCHVFFCFCGFFYVGHLGRRREAGPDHVPASG